VQAGGTVTFNCGPNFVEITVNTSVVGAGTTTVVDGAGRIGLNGEDVRQHFFVQNGGNLTLRNISLLDGGGGSGDGGAIYVGANGRVTIVRQFPHQQPDRERQRRRRHLQQRLSHRHQQHPGRQ
jgi:hypothetical protein